MKTERKWDDTLTATLIRGVVWCCVHRESRNYTRLLLSLPALLNIRCNEHLKRYSGPPIVSDPSLEVMRPFLNLRGVENLEYSGHSYDAEEAHKPIFSLSHGEYRNIMTH